MHGTLGAVEVDLAEGYDFGRAQTGVESGTSGAANPDECGARETLFAEFTGEVTLQPQNPGEAALWHSLPPHLRGSTTLQPSTTYRTPSDTPRGGLRLGAWRELGEPVIGAGVAAACEDRSAHVARRGRDP